ncbi:hypothetical protein PGT21_001097 [Puccinia graminis f. sp. tritici]|uniref:Uncharacterized protein n=1 Tax=Puccinia graminis f. sp. tritici TaxID=56615 RepID=A0A5B0QLW3_PUCGR|nr:hypothetical protein PGT21_001097 [Puccinia graminis f. sp. tritici]
MLSRAVFDEIRVILGFFCQIKIPAWSTIRRGQARIRKLLDMEVQMSQSVWGTPCASELANPLVAPHIEFYPEDCHGRDVFKLSQSQKWLKHLPKGMRPQMCTNNDQHFYIFEPLQTFAKLIVIPLFFYTNQSQLYSKCYLPDIVHPNPELVQFFIPPNISFDDTNLHTIQVTQFENDYAHMDFGNLSTISTVRLFETNSNDQPCLPPKFTNQEYNCHFLSTSNRAGVLEIANQVINDTNDMLTDGFEAYDTSISQPVFVMSMMLCFLADSPMHAEITNTPNPGTSLNPCRMCTLHSPTKIDKQSSIYLRQFLQLDSNGSHSPNDPRLWQKTIENTYDLYNTFVTVNITEVKRLQTIYGVTDSMNNKFIEGLRSKSEVVIKKVAELRKEGLLTDIFNPVFKLQGFDGCTDTPVEILHVFLLGVVKYLIRDFIQKIKKDKNKTKLQELTGRLQSFNTNSLNIPLVKPSYLIHHSQSLVGKDFKIFLQAVPFIFFPLMDQEQRDMWLALAQLSSYIFQTRINNMETYLYELKQHIQIFMSRLIQFTAQWINKPKFHMLFHLLESIARFGPATLCATEEFESYNGVLRNLSTHSNKQAPGRDIANNFANYQCLRFLLSGGIIYNKITQTISQCSPQMMRFFTDNPIIQKSFGYSAEILNPMTHFPYQKRSPLSVTDVVNLPKSLKETFPNEQIRQISQLQLNAHEAVVNQSFILVGSPSNSAEYVVELLKLMSEELGGDKY